MYPYIMLIIGFILLIQGADCFVAGSSSLAKKLGISPLIVGLTVVAFGTSAPELTVSVTAGMKGANALAISNVLGSNLFNLLVVIGGCAIFAKQSSDPTLLKRDWPLSFFAMLALTLMISVDKVLSRMDGLMLLGGFFVVIFLQITQALLERKTEQNSPEDSTDMPKNWVIFVKIVVGIACIIFGGDFCVVYATEIAHIWGWSETVIGLTVVSIGTSLPELVTSIAATRRGERDIAIGNVVGSNLFNVLLILSISSILTPIPVEPVAIIDAMFLCFILLFVFSLALREKINRASGIAMVSSYLIYMSYVFYRETVEQGVSAIL